MLICLTSVEIDLISGDDLCEMSQAKFYVT